MLQFIVIAVLLAPVHAFIQLVIARVVRAPMRGLTVGLGPQLYPKDEAIDSRLVVCLVPMWTWARFDQLPKSKRGGPWIRQLVARFGGPLGCYLTASALVLLVALTGWPTTTPSSPMVVEEVIQDLPAAEAGMLSGDVIRRANGHELRDVRHLSEVVMAAANSPITLDVERSGEELQIVLTPREHEGRFLLGVSGVVESSNDPLPVGEAFVQALTAPAVMFARYLERAGRALTDRSEGRDVSIGAQISTVVNVAEWTNPLFVIIVLLAAPTIVIVALGLLVSDLIRGLVSLRRREESLR